MARKRASILHSDLQDYLATLANGSAEKDSVRQANLLFSFAELKFRMGGGGKCGVCRAHVRHVLPAEVEHEDGTLVKFACLCTRCLVAEKASARRVTLKIGNASVHYTRPSKLSVSSEPGDVREFRVANSK
ncbi:MAG: hypothetical protein LAN37_11550 [Acidobacteriia bacterium]|nr:hypothetical protein [Terriglobia bacterium]